jgi:D-3-phosphoglycerate dehydrogenase
MPDTVESLILDLLEWIGSRDRTYEEVMDAWRTSCPKLPVWEDANDRGLVAIVHGRVRLTDAGRDLLSAARRSPPQKLTCNNPRTRVSYLMQKR